MQVTETSAEGLHREFTVKVPADDIENKLVSRLGEIGTTATIPGFRPGKVPAAILRKRYGEALRGEVLDKTCLLYTSPSPRDLSTSRMPSSA